jgi:L-lactate dehydrogenase (cytochrome)
MRWNYNTKYPGIDDLRNKAKRKIPGFAFDYLDGGCNEDVNLRKNTDEIREIELKPLYLREHSESNLRTELFGKTYDAPFGVSPIGLQGLMWPNSPKILAQAAFEHNIPFILSTVTTATIEEIAEVTEGNAWFQLYHPAEDSLRNQIIKRAEEAGYPVLVILSDVPTFAYRPRDIRNGLGMPPRMTAKNIMQIMSRPEWALRTLLKGKPEFSTMMPYLPKGLNMKDLGIYMDRTFSGRLNEERVKALRDLWKGKLVLKGVATEEDTETAIRLGLDGIIVSNHGGRQLDAGESTIKSLRSIVQNYQKQITIMMDSGIRSGPDIARTLASGADFTFLGRTFMYSVAALGNAGGEHAIAMLKTQLQQVMEQICCESTKELPKYLARG